MHFFDHFFSDIRVRADHPLLCEKQGEIFHIVTRREIASRLADFGRSLGAVEVRPGDRVTLHASASPILLIAEWAILANRAVAVIAPRHFSPEDLMATLTESKSRLIIVDRMATAYHLAEVSAHLPDLHHIICLEGGAESQLPIWSLEDFIDAGRREADRSTTLMRSIAGKNTALLFYYKDVLSGSLKATRYSHAQLLEHAARIDDILGKAALQSGELLLTATTWEQGLGHIASCYAPILKHAIVQITYGIADVALFENNPQVVVGDAAFFDGIRQNITELVRQSGQLESAMLTKALALSKLSYEARKNAGPLKRIQSALLKATIVKKIKNMLGGRMRLFIGTDNETHYDTQLFFHAFGIELIELPQEAFR